MNFYVLLSFKYNGKIIEWDNDILEELADNIDNTYLAEDHYKIYSDTKIEIEINNEFDEELQEYVGLSGHNENSKNLIKEHLYDVEQAYKKQLVSDLGVYGIAWSFITEKLKEENDIRIFNESYIDNFANAWEISFEEDSIEYLCTVTSEEIEEEIQSKYEESKQESENDKLE